MNNTLSRFCLLTSAVALGLALITGAQAADLSKGQALVAQHGCMGCHGAGLDKPVSPSYPILAGQPASYLFHAMQQYQAAHQTPIYGRDNAIMGGMVATLSTQDLHDIAAYVASLPSPLYAPDLTH